MDKQMKIHEYQAKELLSTRGVAILNSRLCFTLDEVDKALSIIGLPCVIKAQVHAGGRGKAGGVKLALSKEEALKHAEHILAMTIKTPQTHEAGQRVSCVLIEEGVTIQKELYLSLIIDRESQKLCLLASTEGGMDIEEVAKKDPTRIKKILIHKACGLMPYQLRALGDDLNLKPVVKKQFSALVLGIYKTFIECDASLIEINPLVITNDDRLIALDAKISIDENALYRQRAINEMRDPSQEDEKEIEASRHGLAYVALDGSIGCMVNGAGLAMATMDVIQYVGAKPANFLDVGGSATTERVEHALRIIAQDKNVKAIFVNVFGGIAQCDVIAQGIVNAAKALSLSLPLIVRLQGTNVEKGQEILNKSGLRIIAAKNMLEGAQQAAKQAGA
jgi:succinyl-CoA synthetase beta subunit